MKPKDVTLRAGTRVHLLTPQSDATIIKDVYRHQESVLVCIDHVGSEDNIKLWVSKDAYEINTQDFAIIPVEKMIEFCLFRTAAMYTATCAIAKHRSECKDHPYDYNRYCSCTNCPLGVPATIQDMTDHEHIDFFLMPEPLNCEDCYLINIKRAAGKAFIAALYSYGYFPFDA